MDVRTAPSASTEHAPIHDRTAVDAPVRLLWLDAVRATALLVVIVGHYLIAILHLPEGAADLAISSLLDEASWTHPLTWALQVMGVFFAVGGYAAAGSVDRNEVTTGPAWNRWMTARARGLVIPTLPLLAVWLLAGPTLAAAFGRSTVAAASAAALIPLWFLATYLLVQAAVPLWTHLIDRGRLLPTATALLVTVAVVDVAHLADVPAIGYLNFFAVWSLPTLLGAAVARGRLTTRQLCAVTGAGLAIAISLVVWVGYVVPVVGVTLLAIDPIGVTWWSTRPLFTIAALVPTGLLLAAAHRPTAVLLRTATRQPIPRRAGVVLGVLGCAAGIGSIILAGVATTPWVGLALLVGGLLALHRPAL